jgi:hypothetical protein
MLTTKSSSPPNPPAAQKAAGTEREAPLAQGEGAEVEVIGACAA